LSREVADANKDVVILIVHLRQNTLHHTRRFVGRFVVMRRPTSSSLWVRGKSRVMRERKLFSIPSPRRMASIATGWLTMSNNP
jgi:hypothetical protein